ncbi:MAG: hypothetical protein JNL39_04245 [Opitutaceae bacterium]|nr:hypothetical protein [Opitutaceae bacterium]
MILLALLTPLFLCFEIWQLVICERHLGLRQIARGGDPRQGGLGELTAFAWSMMLIGYWVWMLALLFVPAARIAGAGLLAVSVLGYSVRRGAPLRWILIILMFEGAIRLGLLFALATAAWRELR